MTQTPALTPEQWQHAQQNPHLRDMLERCGRSVEQYAFDEYRDRPHALAALCLYQQPFGFTHEDVKLLEEIAKRWEAEASRPSVDDIDDAMRPNRDEIRNRASRIASISKRIKDLLPPASSETQTPRRSTWNKLSHFATLSH